MSGKLTSECGSQCFRTVESLLDYSKVLQNQVDGYTKVLTTRTLEKLENLEKRFSSEEEKLDETSRSLSDSLKSQIDTLDSKLKIRIDILDASYKSQIDNVTKSINDSLDKLKSESLRGLPIKRKTTPEKVFTKIGSKYYYIAHYDRVNWFQAAHKCIALGAHLVSILSEDELNAILPHLQPHVNYWIDLNDLGTEGQFLSIATGLPASFAHWGFGPPNNYQNREHCCDLWWNAGRHGFNDNYCMVRSAYICEPEY